MIRKIVNIDEEKCNGCGLCANACHEGAIEIVDGKALLIKDDYCDGFGDCLPECPTGAITITEREAAAYDEAAVQARMQKQSHGQNAAPDPANRELLQQLQQKLQAQNPSHGAQSSAHGPQNPHAGFHGCPGSRARVIERAQTESANGSAAMAPAFEDAVKSPVQSELQNWPVQIKLAPTRAPYFENARLLIAADCTAYAYARFHQDFIRNHVVLIGCPKLDEVDYTEKLQTIIAENNIKSVKIVRMEVPCCGGLQFAAQNALKNSGKFIPWEVVTIGIDGRILDE